MTARRWGVAGPVLAAMVAGACASTPQAPPRDAAADWIGPGPTLTGAVMSLDAPVASGAEPTRIEEYLRGRVPGLQIIGRGDDFTLRLRGGDLSLMGGRVEPLVVIDGMPIAEELMSRVLRTVQPGEVREITVLRDVASTAVYGTRGAGGVILIRTIGR